jgi:hypothetical protein
MFDTIQSTSFGVFSPSKKRDQNTKLTGVRYGCEILPIILTKEGGLRVFEKRELWGN